MTKALKAKVPAHHRVDDMRIVMDILAASEAVLGEVLDGEPARP